MQKLLKNINTQTDLSYNVAAITHKQRSRKRDSLANRNFEQRDSSAFDYRNNFSKFTI